NAIRDPFDHWLAASPNDATRLLDWVVERAEERLRRRQEKEIGRQNASRKLRLPGKILNVASAGREKLTQNQQLADLLQALGVSPGAAYRADDLRYDRVIIMTDADVDGAHIASLLITFFYRELSELI